MDESFGRWVKRLRQARGLTQRSLAHRVCCSHTMLQKIELDRRRPSPHIAERLAAELIAAADERACFLTAARTLQPPLAPRAPTLPPAAPRAWPLPLLPAPLLGRQADLAAITLRLCQPDTRLLTIVGPPGVGKTSVALWAAAALHDTFADGVLFVSCAELAAPTLLLRTIAQRLQLADVPDERLAEALPARLAERSMLLILDNFEHLTSGAPLISALLSATPALRIMVTSRLRLRVGGEQLYRLTPLSVPSSEPASAAGLLCESVAAALFVARAQLAAEFTLTDQNAPAVAAICRQLDGLPFAIELAAMWTRLLTPEQLLLYLDQHQTLLAQGRQDGPAHHQGLHPSIDWSYQLLSPAAQRLLACMALRRGSATLEMLRAAWAATVAAEASLTVLLLALAELAEHSLLVTSAGPSGETRYRLLETVRRYARDRRFSLAEPTVPADTPLSLPDYAVSALPGGSFVHCCGAAELGYDHVCIA